MQTNIYRLLFEQEEENQEGAPESNLAPKKTGKAIKATDDSIDDQVDGLILKYENASIRDEEPATLSESLRYKSLNFLLEQDEDLAGIDDEGGDMGGEEGGEGGEAAGGEEGADPAGSEDMKVTEPAEEKLPNLDVDAFSSRVARLIKNYKNLLNVEEAILNRAKNFLDENYGDVFVNKFLESLEADHGIGNEEFPSVKYAEDDDFAIGANPAGSGITGGGGA